MKNMVMVFLIAIAPLVLGCAQTPQARVSPPRFSLAISLSPNVVKVGSKVAISVALTNTSLQQITLPAEYEDYGYLVDVSDSTGAAAQETDRGREWKMGQGMRQVTSGIAVPLAPGKTARCELVISDLYDLSYPGKYTIRVHRGPVTSNLIALTLVP
jgi:hypothetical protein